MDANEPSSNLPTVGLFHRLPEQHGVVVGRKVAIGETIEALGKHAAHHRFALFCDTRERAQAQAALAPHKLAAAVRDKRELLRIDELGIRAWHDTDFDTYTPFALRARAKMPFPITLGHHTLSYKELLHDAVLRLLLAKAHPYDAVICTSTAARRTLEELVAHVADGFEAEHGVRLSYPGRYDVIPLAVDTERYQPLDRATARERFHIDPSAFVMLWVGRLSILDKADLLPVLHAFAELRASHPGKRLMLICAGTERPGERFGQAIGDFAQHLKLGHDVRVMTEGASFMPQKQYLYAAADVFISPIDNIQETFGITPVEAMAAGIPQIVSDWNGYRDTVVHGETGFLLPTYWARCQGEMDAGSLLTSSPFDHLALAQSVAVDMRAFVEAVKRLLSEPALLETMGKRSRERAVELYSWPKVVARHEALWAELSEEASLNPAPQRDGARYARPDYGRAFAHFATKILDDDTQLRLTPLGRSLCRGEVSMPTHYIEQWQYLDLNVVKRIVGGLIRSDETGERLSLGRIVAVMSKKSGDALVHDFIVRHAMFLVKYGYAEPLA